MTFSDTLWLPTLGVGVGATAVMDVWLLALKRMGLRTLDFGLLGRWVGHMRHGRLRHAPIAASAPVRGEVALGWLVHYAVGVGFAALLVLLAGPGWLQRPTPVPALLVGIVSVVAPLFVMQPAMGAGVAARRTPAPWTNRLRSLANHTVFGIGLYAAAAALQPLVR